MKAFMVKSLIILFAFGFATNAFANGGGTEPEQPPGCGKNDAVRCTGTKYRCLKDFGYTTSDAKANGKYCAPKAGITCSDAPTKDDLWYNSYYNMKEWKWSLDANNDEVKETPRSQQYCKFTTCWSDAGPEVFWYGGSSDTTQPFYQADKRYYEQPAEGYFYCAKEINENGSVNTDFNGGTIASANSIAKCVDKKGNNNNAVANSKCEGDTMGNRYYYKPNCSTEAECTAKFAQWNKNETIRFCYKPWEQRSDANMEVFFDNVGGQSVRFQEFIWYKNGNINGPCQIAPFYAPQFTLTTTTPPETGDLVVVDDADSDRTASFVHTKVSGEKYKFRLYMIGENGKKLDQEIQNATCAVNRQGGGTATKSRASQRNTNIFSKAIALFTGKSGYVWGGDDGKGWSTDTSGDYTIKCDGESEDGTPLSTGEVQFVVAPHKYVFSSVAVNFTKGGESTLAAPPLELLKSKVEVERTDNTNDANNGKNHSVKIADWKNKPVIKIGEKLSVHLLEAVAMTSTNKVDVGVAVSGNSTGSDKQMGEFSAEFNPTTMRITDFNNPSYQNTSVANDAKCEPGKDPDPAKNTFNPVTTSKVTLQNNNGKLTLQNNPFVELEATEAQIARTDIYLYDVGLRNKIDEEAKSGKCNDSSNFPCPYPKKLLLSDFEYEIAPHNFKVEVLDKNGDPVKVLYFGMGTSPKVEAGSQVRVTALKNDNDPQKPQIATTFSGGKNGSPVCAAQNMSFSGATANNNNTTGQSVYIEIIDRNGTGFSVKATDFENGVASSTDAIIKVQKDKDTPFTPAMKSEPVIITDKKGVTPSEMQYLKFKPTDSYYPQYDGIALGTGNVVVLRARINAIDTDNGSGSNISNAISPTKVWYEFQCEYCNLDKITEITEKTYTRSPTQQGWWIDSAFGENNDNYITANKIAIESGGIAISAVNPSSGVETGNQNAGLQTISYRNATQGTHKLNIRHGNESTNGTFSGATTMPYFLLYNAYWTSKVIPPTIPLTSDIQWNTSSFIYVKGTAPDNKRNYGIDTDGAKNTRSGGRTGKY